MSNEHNDWVFNYRQYTGQELLAYLEEVVPDEKIDDRYTRIMEILKDVKGEGVNQS